MPSTSPVPTLAPRRFRLLPEVHPNPVRSVVTRLELQMGENADQLGGFWALETGGELVLQDPAVLSRIERQKFPGKGGVGRDGKQHTIGTNRP